MACRLLGDLPLTLRAIEAGLQQVRDIPDQLNWELRAFWVAPSLDRFVALGDTMFRGRSEADHRREADQNRPFRPRNPEFEAIKGMLAAGIVSTSPGPAIPTWRRGTTPPPVEDALTRQQLPAASPSFWSPGQVPYAIPLRPFTLADQEVGVADALSAFHKVTLRMTVLGPAVMGRNGSAHGIWDVGEAGITFAKPLRVNGVTATGVPTGADVLSMRADFAAHCGGSAIAVNLKAVNARWRTAVLAWVGKPAAGSAAVATRRFEGRNKYETLVVDTFDLDRDGVADLIVWSGLAKAEASTETFWKAAFANVGGTWELAGFVQEADCT